jgi:hypothetical protein
VDGLSVDPDDVAVLVADVWSAVIGIELHRCAVDGAEGAGEVGEGSMSGEVGIVGGWRGTVAVAVPDALAATAAASMFGLPADELTRVDIDDALGELANMIGGGVKALLPGTSRLSLPRVSPTAEPGSGSGVTGPAALATLRFVDDAGRTVVVAVVPADDDVGVAADAAGAADAPGERVT